MRCQAGLLWQEAPEQENLHSFTYCCHVQLGACPHTCVPCANLLPGLDPSVSVVCSETAAVILVLCVQQPVRQAQPRGRCWVTFSGPSEAGRARLSGKGLCPGGGDGAWSVWVLPACCPCWWVPAGTGSWTCCRAKYRQGQGLRPA